MASLGWIGMGITSSQGRGISKHSGLANMTMAQKAKMEKPAKLPSRCALTFEEVQHIRALDDAGTSRKEIFKNHIAGKMTYSGMVNILEYITRAKR